jgi:hypothetical protein
MRCPPRCLPNTRSRERWNAALNETDIHRVISATADKLLRPVQRIDQKEAVGQVRELACRDFFLGDHRNARRRMGQTRENERFGAPIRRGHRRGVGFALYLALPLPIVRDHPAGCDGKIDHGPQQPEPVIAGTNKPRV